MSLSAKDLKVINWYGKEHGLTPQLSTPPIIYFKRRDNGEQITADLTLMTTSWSAWNEEDKRQRARERKMLK